MRMIFQKFIAVVIFSPVFPFPGVAAFVIGAMVGQICINTQLPKVSNACSPLVVDGNSACILFTDGGSRLTGLCRPYSNTYSAQDSFGQETLRRIDRVARPSRVFRSLNRRISIRVDAVGTTFSPSAVYLVHGTGPIHEPGSAANTGCSLNMAVGFSSMILWWVRRLKSAETSTIC